MSASHLFAYNRKGTLIVLGDGAEILVHNGEDEAPKWRRTVGADLAAVGATDEHVVSLTSQGQLAWWSGNAGEVVAEVDLAATPRAFAVAADGTCAVALAEEVALVPRGGARRALAVTGATAVAWSADGSRVAVGGEDGRVRVVSANDGAQVGTVDVGVPVRSVAWNAKGFWLATGGDKVFRVAGDGSEGEQITRASDMEPDCVTCSADGAVFALRVDDATVVALAYPSKDTVASIHYIERKVVGVAFGPAPFFGIGMDRGDGNKINLRTGAVHRTDTHPGRTHNRWMLSVSVESKDLPADYGGGPAAGGAAPAGGGAPSGATEPGAGGGSKVQVFVAVALALVGIAILVARCS
jgi:hypothetical protein